MRRLIWVSKDVEIQVAQPVRCPLCGCGTDRATPGHGSAPKTLQVQDVTLDLRGHKVWRACREIELSRTEFRLVDHLMRNAGRLVAHDELMRNVWDTTFFPSPKVIHVYVGRV